MAKAPVIDGRTGDQVLAALLAHAPGYTPGWQPAAGTTAYALLSVFARMVALQGAALDRLPDRSRIAFLDAVGNSLLPALPARAPVVFTLMDAAPLDVTLPARTQVAAKLLPFPPSIAGDAAGPPPAPLFFIEQSVTLTRGRIAAAYSIDPAADKYHDHLAELASGPTLFDCLVPIPHVLYLGHDELFKLSGSADVILKFDVAAARAAGTPVPLLIDWEYLSEDGWLALEVVEDDTARLTRDGRIRLRLECGPDAKEDTLAAHKSYWIRGSVSAHGPSARVGALPAGWQIRVGVSTALASAPPLTVDGTGTATIVNISGREIAIDKALNGARAGAILRHGVTKAFLAEIAAVRDPYHLVIAGVAAGRTITIAGASRACVVGADDETAVLNAPLTGAGVTAGAQILDVETGSAIGTLVQVVPGFRVPVLDGSRLLAGDVVTVDGNSSAAVTAATATFLTLDAAIVGAVPGADVVLANARAALAIDQANPPGQVPLLDVIRAQVGLSTTGIVPDAAYNDAVPIDVRTVFRPFGVQPQKFTSFYVASGEVFKRAGATVSLAFRLASPGKGYSDTGTAGVGSGKLEWAVEYYDGETWTALGDADALRDDTAYLTAGKANDVTRLSFVAPADWTEVEVNGVKNLWLRIRIVTGNYGHPMQLTAVVSGGITTTQVDPDTLAPPVLLGLAIDFTYLTRTDRVQHCLTFNDFAYADHSDDAQWPNRPFEPFTRVADETRAVHIGFTQPPPPGIISLFAAPASAPLETEGGSSPFVWEYFGAHGWTELGVADETSGFARAGVIQFVGPADAVPADGLGGVLYRIRARVKRGFEVEPRRLAGIWLNGVWAQQGESVVNDTLGMSNGNPSQTFVFQPRRVPVAPGEVIEVREWTGRGDDWETMVAGVPLEDLRFEVDPRDGRTKVGVWVRWHERQHLFDSTPRDRHYALERSAGVLRFGGMIPPAGARIVATYTAGGDITGNVAAGTITELRSGIGYVQTITNPLPATGGTAVEHGWIATTRSTARLANRNRSVSAADYEWIAHEASPDVARVRCLPVEGPPGKPLRGWVTLVVVPHTTDPAPRPSPEFVRRVLAAIRARVPAGVGPRVRMAPPTYVTVQVRCEIVLLRSSDVAAVEKDVRRSLAAFLHPLTGGARGHGFGFGDTVYLSDVASLLERIRGVDYLRHLQLEAGGALQGDVVRLPAHALPTAGDHTLTLSLGAA